MVRGQISFEYLIVVGIAILILIPSLFFFLLYSKSGSDSAVHGTINDIGLEMIKATSISYSLGKNAWNTLELNIPEQVNGLYISDANELVITYYTQHGVMSAVFFPEVNITNSSGMITDDGLLNPIAEPRPGLMKFTFRNQGNIVSISEKE